MANVNRILRLAGSVTRRLMRDRTDTRTSRPRAQASPGGAGATSAGVIETTEYNGPLPPLTYAPRPDDAPDPGEVVWAWIPYDENDGRGKDRPALVLARLPQGLLALQMTSKDHDRDGESDRFGRVWFDVGSGGWDRQGRDSEVRIDRLLLIPEGAVRREGAALDSVTYGAVAEHVRAHHG